MRVVWLTWSLLTWLSAMLCGGGCLLPYWLRGSFNYKSQESFSDLGLFRRCVYPVRSVKDTLRVVTECGYYEFEDVPHVYWKICLVMLALSTCILFFLTFLLFILGFCLDLLKVNVVHRSCQIGQFSAGLLVLVSCILYPMGWHSNPEVLQICGQSTSIISLGRCHVGWAFVLTCAGGLLALLTTTIPALLLRNGCHNSTIENQYPVHRKITSTSKGSVRYSNDLTSLRPPSQNATRYSYVSYQSLLAPHPVRSVNNPSIGREDPIHRNSAFIHPSQRIFINNHAAPLLQPTALSDSNRSTTSSKEREL